MSMLIKHRSSQLLLMTASATGLLLGLLLVFSLTKYNSKDYKLHTGTFIHIHTYVHVCFADYEEIDHTSVIITNADEPYSLNITIYNDSDFSEPNETLVISLSVGFGSEFNDADAASLQSRIFFDLRTTTVTVISSGKIHNVYTNTNIHHNKQSCCKH